MLSKRPRKWERHLSRGCSAGDGAASASMALCSAVGGGMSFSEVATTGKARAARVFATSGAPSHAWASRQLATSRMHARKDATIDEGSARRRDEEMRLARALAPPITSFVCKFRQRCHVAKKV